MRTPFFELLPPQSFFNKMVEVPLIVYVPNASYHIPREVRRDLLLTDAELREEHALCVDPGLEEQARICARKTATVFLNGVSPLVVRLNRLYDTGEGNELARGHDVVPMRTADGRPLRGPDFTEEKRQRLVRRYYLPFWTSFRYVLDHYLSRHEEVWIIELRTYPSLPAPNENPPERREAAVIHWHDFHRPEQLIDWWLKSGLARKAIGESPVEWTPPPWPYRGKDKRVRMVGVGINRGVLVDENSWLPLASGSPWTEGLRDFLSFARGKAEWDLRAEPGAGT